LKKSSLRHAFLCHLVDCCVRLSYPDHIKSILPTTYTTNTDCWDVKGPRINYFLKEVEPSLFNISEDLTSALKIKDSGEAIEKSMGAIREWTLTASNDAKAVFMYRDAEGIASQVFVQCLMMLGQKSFSHLLNAVERNITSVQEYMSGERGVALVAHVWGFHHQFLEICVDKLTNYRVFTAESVIAWVCDQVGYEKGDGGVVKAEVYYKPVYWNILSSVLAKVNLRVTQARKSANESTDADDAMDQSEGESASNALASAERDSKAAYIFVMTRFADLIEAKVKMGGDVQRGMWWKWVVGGVRELFRKFEGEIGGMKFTLGAMVFEGRDEIVKGVWRDGEEFFERRVSAA
jgi:nuclear cap-binding protein subunit 1